MPVVRTHSRKVNDPGDLENADNTNSAASNDSGVEFAHEDANMSTRKRQPLKRKQQQQQQQQHPQRANDTKKRRMCKNSHPQEQSAEEVQESAGDRRPTRRAAKASGEKNRVDKTPEVQQKTPRTGSDRRKSPESDSREAGASRSKPRRDAEPEFEPEAKPSERKRPVEDPPVKDATRGKREDNSRTKPAKKTAEPKKKLEVETGTAMPSIGRSRARRPPASVDEVEDGNSNDSGKVSEVSSSGRPRRASRPAMKLVEIDSENESEEDFSDNDDEDFVLPKSDESEDDEIAAEEIENEVLEDEHSAPKGVKHSAEGRLDKMRKFLDEIEEPSFVKKNIEIESSGGSAKMKIDVPNVKRATAKRAKGTDSRRSVNVKEEKSSDFEDNDLTAGKAKKLSKAKAAAAAGRARKKRSLSSDESTESIVVAKKAKSSKKGKNPNSEAQKKTFMKPRKALKAEIVEQKTQTGFGSSRYEMNLLKLAKQMDCSDESGDESQDNSQDEEFELKTEHTSAEQKKNESNEAEKKLLIMSMLKQHEEVDEMSVDSSDDEVNNEKPPLGQDVGIKCEKAPKCEEIETKPLEEIETKKPDELKAEKKPRGKKAGKSEKVKAQQEAKKPESKSTTRKGGKKAAAQIPIEDESSDSDDDNWEVVKDAAVRDPNYQRPEKVTVVLQNDDFLPDAKRLSMEQRMIRLINRKRKANYLLCHRVHLLALLGHQRFLNSTLDDDHVRAYALSRLPPTIAVPANVQKDSQIVRQLLHFYKAAFELKSSDEVFSPKMLRANLIKLLMKRVTSCKIVHMFGLLLLLRVSGIRSRLCLSHHLLPHKAPLLRLKDGDIVEIGLKTKSSDTGISDFFLEVYLSDTKRWRPLDIDDFNIIENHHELTPHLEQPVASLIGIDNDGRMMDLSPKYNADWLNKIKTLRGDSKFFNDALASFAPEEAGQAEEQQEVATVHEQHGIPKIISELKNHPKYALRRHLLKFEAFYPPEPQVLGYARNEPVYPREAVHTLRSKDTWHRQARQVMEGEVPYNVVKARPKWNKRTESFDRDLPLEVYGEWQTEAYKAPVAMDGVVPRNKFGNVELFHPDMLPGGTVHLKLPGLQRIASELQIDCVPAVIGFDGVGRGCHPVLEGFVVCVENKELLEEAWHERQREDRHRRRERIRKRAVKNWKKIIKKVIWDLRLKKKYKTKLEQE